MGTRLERRLNSGFAISIQNDERVPVRHLVDFSLCHFSSDGRKINQMSSLDTFIRSSRNRKFANVVSLGTKLLFSSKREKRWREKSSAKSPGYNVFEKMKRRSIVNRSVLKQHNIV